MRVLLYGFLVCFLHVHNLYAQDAKYGKKIVKKMAKPRMNGRGYYKNGDTKAAHFLEKQFGKLQLKSFTENGYRQSYQFPVNYFPKKMSVCINGKSLQPGVDFLIDATSPSIEGDFQIVIGKRKQLLDTADLFGLVRNANGKFLYFENSKDSTESPEEKKVIDQNLQYMQWNQDIHAKGLILYSPDKLTWTVLPYQGKKAVIQLHKKLADPISVKLNITAQFDSVYHTQNLIGFIPGTTIKDSFLVISAHYDHLGRMGKHTLFPGANDNASGTGFLLSLAKYYSKHPSKYSIVFLLFSGEEIGLKGSEYFTNHPLFDLKRIKFLWNFDMAGTGKEGIQVVNSTIFTKQFSVLDSLNKSAHLLPEIKQRGSAANSDHYWFYEKGVPCFFSYTLGGVHYHDIEDTYKSLPFDAWNNYLELVKLYFNSF